jgi:hypothetical protein
MRPFPRDTRADKNDASGEKTGPVDPGPVFIIILPILPETVSSFILNSSYRIDC